MTLLISYAELFKPWLTVTVLIYPISDSQWMSYVHASHHPFSKTRLHYQTQVIPIAFTNINKSFKS
jgi:hypothetical protein